mmetsp:Transcript_21848/g.75117  ORF Transcript_21848/g.75117 Transcript_21848/m.75117 type:complete len:271 (-) Transcript_21848:451-1263(-)
MQVLEVRVGEPWHCSHACSVQALLPVADQARQKVLGDFGRPIVPPSLQKALRQHLRVGHDARLDLADGLGTLAAARVEGHHADEALEGDDAEGPEIRLRAKLTEEALGCHVLRRADDAVQSLPAVGVAEGAARVRTLATLGVPVAEKVAGFAKPEVQELQVARHSDHNVVWLHVSVNEAALVHGVDRLQQFSHVEPSLLFCETALALQVADEVASLNELHHHVDVLRVLKGREQLNAPPASSLRKRVSLTVGSLAVLVVVSSLIHLLQGK